MIVVSSRKVALKTRMGVIAIVLTLLATVSVSRLVSLSKQFLHTIKRYNHLLCYVRVVILKFTTWHNWFCILGLRKYCATGCSVSVLINQSKPSFDFEEYASNMSLCMRTQAVTCRLPSSWLVSGLRPIDVLAFGLHRGNCTSSVACKGKPISNHMLLFQRHMHFRHCAEALETHFKRDVCQMMFLL